MRTARSHAPIPMNIFNIHDQVIQDYRSYIESFIEIQDERIRNEVQQRLHDKHLWPDPLVQFNPSYAPADGIDALVDDGLLHPDLATYLGPLGLYRHQAEAMALGMGGRDFVVTSGTGSGKSLTFLATIFNAVARDALNGICAVIVYPMNALINSQTEEIKKHKEKFEAATGKPFPVTCAQYTGQEGQEQRERTLAERPHILLTNYMMMELIMTRSREQAMRVALRENLQFLVFDELHTYRGRQGADVAILNRRVRDLAQREVVSIGTSATMASGHGTLAVQRDQVAQVATALFGRPITREQIVNEKLERQLSRSGTVVDRNALADAVREGTVSISEEDLPANPIAIWLESAIGLEEKEGELVRGQPRAIPDIAGQLERACGVPARECEEAVRGLLGCVERVNDQRTKRGERAYLPFKLHQFIKQTGSVYVTLQDRATRTITLDAGYYIVDDEKRSLPIYPVVFSRLSGLDFVCVRLDAGEQRLRQRDFFDQGRTADDDDEDAPANDGYVILDPDDVELWKDEYQEYLPSGWLTSKSGRMSLRKEYQERLPRRIWFDAHGRFSFEPSSELELSGWFVQAPLLLDPSTGTVYDRRTKEGTKLARLGSEARSTATSILSQSVVQHLRGSSIGTDACKLLSFTDNRQDASLQAGHFNDFVRVIHFRSAIYRALSQSENPTIAISELPGMVVRAMKLNEEDYAKNPSTGSRFHTTDNPAQRALERLVLHRILEDLRRGWRLILPNLERCGLLHVEYSNLQVHAVNEDGWRELPGFAAMPPARRAALLAVVLDYFRRHFALSHVHLESDPLEHAGNEIRDQLRSPWTLEDDERLRRPSHLGLQRIANPRVHTESLGYASRLGQHLRADRDLQSVLRSRDEYNDVIGALLEAFSGIYLAREVVKDDAGHEHAVYRLRASEIRWRAGDGTSVDIDPVQFSAFRGNLALKPNEYFQKLYRDALDTNGPLVGAEHTAQLTSDDRIVREERFRKGEIQALFCSPTMELGIDIADLSIVHMRNVPPSPANYAQRSGRAGRSGQAALVFTYCSNGSPHDRHYLARPQEMVSGVVKPPIIDLTNEELLRAHLYAMYLEHVGLDALDESLKSLIDFANEETLELLPEVKERLRLSNEGLHDVGDRFRRLRASLPTDWNAEWYSDDWIAQNLSNAPTAFDRVLNRWRHLYRAARKQVKEAQAVIDNPILKKTHESKREAERSERQARRQLGLLLNETGGSRGRSEFYPYSYLAAEGYLPGYNFTRMPMRVFLPVGDGGEFIDRSRTVGLSEFGPYNQIYHNGSRYQTVRLQALDIENSMSRAKVSKNSGYFLTGSEYGAEVCPFTRTSLQGATNSDLFMNLVEVNNVAASPLTGITCEEEERTRRGFDIKTYFSVDGEIRSVKTLALSSEGKDLLTLKYIPTARLYHVNTKWGYYREKGFLLNVKTGVWLKSPVQPTPDRKKGKEVDISVFKRVAFYTSFTADALYIHPSAALPIDSQQSVKALTTLQYALALAIERVFNVEPREISVQLMGETSLPNVMIYESAQGSLGVLSQIASQPDRFRDVIDAAYDICHFTLPPEEESTLPPASYDDLLSYFNQRDHEKIDRHLIRDTLALLKHCDVEARGTDSEPYQERYARIRSMTDPNSELERRFIDALYARGIRLPDDAQRGVPDIYCRPDFFYEPNVYVFVDGSVHDRPDVVEGDRQKRRAMRNDGLRIIEYSYDDDIDAVIKQHADIFNRVRQATADGGAM